MTRWKIWLASAALALVAASCALLSPIEDDRFVCGVFEGGAVRVCDGPGEVCICSQHRCAVQARDRCPSGFRYRFPTIAETLGEADGGQPPDCVREGLVHPLLPHDLAGQYCPGQDPAQPVACGVSAHDGGYVPCPDQQVCLCHTNQCAIVDASCADGGLGLRSVATWTCVGDAGVTADSLRPRSDGSCPGQAPYDVFKDGG